MVRDLGSLGVLGGSIIVPVFLGVLASWRFNLILLLSAFSAVQLLFLFFLASWRLGGSI
jgi:hypothetical protein